MEEKPPFKSGKQGKQGVSRWDWVGQDNSTPMTFRTKLATYKNIKQTVVELKLLLNEDVAELK